MRWLRNFPGTDEVARRATLNVEREKLCALALEPGFQVDAAVIAGFGFKVDVVIDIVGGSGCFGAGILPGRA